MLISLTSFSYSGVVWWCYFIAEFKRGFTVFTECCVFSAEQISLAERFFEILQKEAAGFSSECHYDCRPETLRHTVMPKMTNAPTFECVIEPVIAGSYEVRTTQNTFSEADFLDALVRARFETLRQLVPSAF